MEHFHEGNMTYRNEGIKSKTPSTFVEVSPELAEERGLTDGTLVRLSSPYGAVKIKCIVTDRVQGKEIYIPLNDTNEAAVNLLTSSKADKDTDTPVYKEVKAKMEILKDKGTSPLPKINHRYGNPQPQKGVMVERKWARKDYMFPGDMVTKEGINYGKSH